MDSHISLTIHLRFESRIINIYRHEIAKCSEKAYSSLPIADAITLLYFKTEAEVVNFAKERGWSTDTKTKTLVFGKGQVDASAIPVHDVIHNVLYYAKELERIV